MSSYIAAVKENTAVRSTISVALGAYSWTMEHLWPVYSMGVVVSAVALLAAAHEKQTIADHLYGANAKFRENTDAISTDAKSLLEKEAEVGVKHDVWMMERGTFQREYDASR